MSSVNKACKPYNSKDKWIVSVLAGLLFLLVSLPFTYRLFNYVSTTLFNINLSNKEGCPTMIGVIVMAIVFLLITRLLMR